ncbi:MAG: hypothetical protein ABIH46_06540 [Chloroflexota bacterium]
MFVKGQYSLVAASLPLDKTSLFSHNVPMFSLTLNVIEADFPNETIKVAWTLWAGDKMVGMNQMVIDSAQARELLRFYDDVTRTVIEEAYLTMGVGIESNARNWAWMKQQLLEK